ncbi:succinylglutamate desuccinylase/aspartoacylase family protein [Halodesulfurarchaeum sp.]|uniref:succinylglutamate desuccinylase/aspartoacylase family protein n=1 Tax=Halodesulfurarchaeum sp. TaxID=1980530 RepID=UPI001BC15B76|nr:succinylglutamate desuccinylase/aspartoacylase family protein [Halodesulfurarchaeum sp.]
MQSLGTAEADPGTKATGHLSVGERRDGSELGLPVAVINGAEGGRHLHLQAVSDGDELNGLGVLTRLLPQLDPAEISGTITVVAIANIHGFQVAEHRNPIDDTKLNRAYPGDPKGSSSDRIAHATLEAATEADLVIDLHQGSTSQMIDETRVRCGRHHRLHEECLELARVFDAGHVLDQQGPEGQLARVAPDAGVPTIDPELGGAVGWDDSSIDVGVRGVTRVLNYYDLLDGQVSPKDQIRASGFDRYGAPVGGLVSFQQTLGDRVEPGEPLFTVLDPFGAEKTRVAVDQSGIFWRARRLPQVATGEYVCSVGTGFEE